MEKEVNNGTSTIMNAQSNEQHEQAGDGMNTIGNMLNEEVKESVYAVNEGIDSISGAANLGDKDHSEGPVAGAIEQQTAKLPSDLFLWAALGSIGASLIYKLIRKDHGSLFVGQWVPSFLLLGLYNKLVKTEGHDKADKTMNDVQ